MNTLSAAVKSLRKQFNMTQEELSVKSGVGLRFVRNLEQGKSTLRLDKVNQLLDFFKTSSYFSVLCASAFHTIERITRIFRISYLIDYKSW